MTAHEEFACGSCPKRFQTLSRFNQHLKTHSKPYKCNLCSKGFGLRADLTRHVQSKHRTGHQQFRCEDCGRHYLRKDNLAQHKKVSHQKDSSNTIKLGKTPSISISLPAEDTLRLVPESSLLFQSASNGELGSVERLIDSGTDLNLRADDGSSALHCAARTGQIAVIQFLITRGADIHVKSRKGTSPLYETIIGGHMDCFLLLLQAGADMTDFWSGWEAQSNFADHFARAGNCEHMMAFLVKVPEDKCDQAVLRLAIASAKFGQVAMLQHLHKVGNIILETLHGTNRQPYALNAAVHYGQLAAVKFLLPLYGRPRSLFRLLRLAAGKGWAHICDALLAYQSDTKLDDALYVASRKGHTAVIKILLDHQKATRPQSELILRELMLAALWNDNFDSLRYLVLYDTGVPPRDDEGPGGLSRVASVKYLLIHGLKINNTGHAHLRSRRHKSGTLLHLAASHDDLDLAQFVLEHEDFDKENIDKAERWRAPWPQPAETALDIAQVLGHTEVADLLLAHGATNHAAQTPFSKSNSDLEMQEASNSDSDTDLEDDEEFDHVINSSS